MMTRRMFVLLAMLLPLCLLAAEPQVSRDKLLVVVNREPGTVSIFKVEGKDLTLLKNIPVGKEPREVALSPDGKRAYISNPDASGAPGATKQGSISVIDLDALKVITTITHPNLLAPDGGAVSADGKKFYVVASARNSVFVIDTANNQVLQEIPVGLGVPRRLTFSPDGKKLYCGSNKTPMLAVIDVASGTLSGMIPVGNETRGGIAFSPDGKLLLAGAVEDDTVYYIDAATEKVIRIQGVAPSPQRIVFSPSGTAFVLGRMSGTVWAIRDLNKHDKSVEIPVGKAPWGLDISDDGRFVYASSNNENTITVIDVATLKAVNKVTVEKDPQGIAFRR